MEKTEEGTGLTGTLETTETTGMLIEPKDEGADSGNKMIMLIGIVVVLVIVSAVILLVKNKKKQ